jgi:hypothetical protein
MATTRTAVRTEVLDGTILYKWTGLVGASADPGNAVQLPDGALTVTVGCAGISGGGVITWQGSMDGGTTWGGLHDVVGVVLTQSDATIKMMAERPLLVRPLSSVGGTQDAYLSLDFER